MAMSASTIASQLMSLVPVAMEVEAIATLTSAYGTFALQSQAGAVPITPVGVSLGESAMRGALLGVSTPGSSAAVLAAAVQAFWVAVAGGGPASFAAATAIVPPPNAGLRDALDATFTSNVESRADLATAAQAVATALFNQVIIGGSVTFPGPTTSPIT